MKATEIPIIFPRILLCGDYGVGKTYAIGLLHKKLKEFGSRGAYMIDLDVGCATLRSAGFDVEVETMFDKSAKEPVVYDRIQERITQFEQSNYDFHLLAIDSLTALHTAVMNYAIYNNQISGKYIMGQRVANVNDYGYVVNVFNQFFPQLMAVSQVMAYLLTAHIREMEHPVTKEVRYTPAITGKSLPSQIGDWFNEVWKMDIDSAGNRVIQTVSADRMKCKTQIAGMPPYVGVEDAIDRLIKAYALDSIGNKPKQLDLIPPDPQTTNAETKTEEIQVVNEQSAVG